MKIIASDNFNRDENSDTLIAENVNEYYAPLIAKLLNDVDSKQSPCFYKAVENNYELYIFEC